MADDPAAVLRARLRGEVLAGEPLARHTSLRVGGAADWFVTPADPDDLRDALRLTAEMGLPCLVIGGGFNLLVRDGGYRGAVLSLRNLRRLERGSGSRLIAEAGVTNAALAAFAAQEGLSGLEFLAGIPGTVGGALSMNAGAHGGAVIDRVESLVSLVAGTFQRKERSELDYGYRFLRLSPGEIVTEATFMLQADAPAAVRQRMDDLLALRRGAQHVTYPNAGSFFKNPEGQQAWRLIESAGLRGYCVGGAQVSEVHANFLVNRGGATATDFLQLARLVKEKVRRASGVVLEEEVRIVGEE